MTKAHNPWRFSIVWKGCSRLICGKFEENGTRKRERDILRFIHYKTQLNSIWFSVENLKKNCKFCIKIQIFLKPITTVKGFHVIIDTGNKQT